MARYSYTVVNSQNQQLSGTINAPSIKHAREELNQLGLSVVSIEEITNIPENAKLTESSFDFEAFDTTGRKITGRIHEADKQTAYKRLRSEYSFDITALYPSNLTEAEKEAERKKGIQSLLNEFNQNTTPSSGAQEIPLNTQFVERQKHLQQKIEYVLAKVNEFFDQFSQEIKPEEAKSLKEQVDKIKVLKTSTNLDHLQKLCENILEKIQSPDIFIHQDQFKKEKATTAIQAKKLIQDLHSAPKAATQNTTDSPTSKISQYFNNFLEQLFHEDPQVVAQKEALHQTTSEILQYMKLFVKSKSSEEKAQIKEQLHNLYQQRKSQSQELSQLKHQLAEKHQAETNSKDLSTHIFSFTGWLLSFYLLYYFTSIYISLKPIVFSEHSPTPTPYETVIFKYLLPIIFLTHIALGLKEHFLPQNKAIPTLAIPLISILSLIIIFNF